MFWLKLALTFGEPNVPALKRRMPLKQFYQWFLYDCIRPFGDDAEDYRSAFQTAKIFSMFLTEDSEPLKLRDFVAFVDKTEEAQTSGQTGVEQLAMWKMATAHLRK